jgi:hypothetical protein
LIAEYPPLEVVTEGRPYRSNQRFSYPAHRAMEDARVSPLWREMVRAHASQEFLADVLRVFGPAIRRTYPEFEEERGDLERLRAGLRKRDTFNEADVLLDAQICVNTPVTAEPTSVREAHLDDPRKLFAGLFYLRRPEDDSSGGDLELYRYRTNRFRFHQGQMIEPRYVETVKTIPYGKNVLVLFLNSLNSLHGVSVRRKTDILRCFLNLVGEVERPLFDLKSLQENRLKRFLRRHNLFGVRESVY